MALSSLWVNAGDLVLLSKEETVIEGMTDRLTEI